MYIYMENIQRYDFDDVESMSHRAKAGEVHLDFMKQLDVKCKNAKPLSKGDNVVLVDIHPHSGDHALGTVLLSNDPLGSIFSFKPD